MMSFTSQESENIKVGGFSVYKRVPLKVYFMVFVTIYTILRVERISQALRQPFTGIINSYARELGILKDKDANFNGQMSETA